MKLSRHWIDTRLTTDQRTLLVDWLVERSAHPTGELIREGIEELFLHIPADELPSIQSCIGWRNKAWAYEIGRRELREQSQAAATLSDEAGDRTAEANKRLLDSLIFEDLQTLRQARVTGVPPDAESLDRIHGMMLSAARATQSVQRVKKTEAEVNILRTRLEQIEVEKAKAEAVLRTTLDAGKRKGGLTAQELEAMERELRMVR